MQTAPTLPAPALTTDIIVKMCSCGRTYTAAAWVALPDLKVWTVEDCDSLEVFTYEQHPCPCGSHMCMEYAPVTANPHT